MRLSHESQDKSTLFHLHNQIFFDSLPFADLYPYPKAWGLRSEAYDAAAPPVVIMGMDVGAGIPVLALRGSIVFPVRGWVKMPHLQSESGSRVIVKNFSTGKVALNPDLIGGQSIRTNDASVSDPLNLPILMDSTGDVGLINSAGDVNNNFIMRR